MEHLQHFGLSDDPFRNELRLRDFLQTPASRDGLSRLERGIRQQRGLMLFTGGVGSGKSMVVRQLLETLEEEIFEASLVVLLRSEVDADWLLARFAKMLGVEEPESQHEPLLAQVYEQLAIVREEGRQAVLIIDDADALAAGGALADVCGLLKLEYEERRMFTLVLAGGDDLERAVASDLSLQQRVELHVHMQPLDVAAGTFYLDKRIEQAGGDTALLDPAAVTALHEIAGGRPGLMNLLADNAFYEAFLAGRRNVEASDVQRAHADLGWKALVAPVAAPGPPQPSALPSSPERAPAAATAEATVLMGGALDDSEPLELLDAVESSGGDLDSDLDAVFATTGPGAAQVDLPDEGPPKDESEEDLVVALLEE
ncbi:MAG: AAA family ATPase [Deltaproteobacteria bacterium]|nr:AAA family ATPase [Deltaproteobacteria bacterium]